MLFTTSAIPPELRYSFFESSLFILRLVIEKRHFKYGRGPHIHFVYPEVSLTYGPTSERHY